MRRLSLPLSLLLIAAPAMAGQREPAAMPGWMAGEWHQVDGAWTSQEFWTPDDGGVMIGAGKVLNGSALEGFEHMRIARDAEGQVAFYASPSGATPFAHFPMVSQTADEIVFENAEHDFPQRIRYWREGDTMRAAISKIDGSDRIEWTFRRLGR